MFDDFGINAGYVEELHNRWLQSPHSVEEGWRSFFEERLLEERVKAPPPLQARTTTNGNGAVAYREAVRETVIAATELQSRVAQLVNAYRVRGHLFADVDPLGNPSASHPE